MAKKKVKAKTDASKEPFEESLARLETIVTDLEGGELGLADALSKYEEGVGRLKHCHSQLESAERRIELLSGVDSDGNPVTAPFDDSATADSGNHSAKRSAPNPEGEGVDGSTRLF